MTYLKEKTEQEYYLYREGVYYKTLPKLCTIAGAILPATLIRIRDPQVRSRLSINYQKIIDRAKFDLNGILKTGAYQCKEEYRSELNGFLTMVWDAQRRLPELEKMSPTMVSTIELRQTNINQFIRTLYGHRQDLLVLMPIVIMREFT